LTPNTSYSFGIRAHNDNVGDSSETTITETTKLATSVKPQAPTNVKADTVRQTDVTLIWDKVVGADGYYIYHNSSYSSAGYNGITIYGLTPDTSYTFYVSAYNQGGGESGKTPVSFKTPSSLCNGDCQDYIPSATTSTYTGSFKERISYYPSMTEVEEDSKFIALPNENQYVETFGPYDKEDAEFLSELFSEGTVFSSNAWEMVDGKEIRSVKVVNGAPIVKGPIDEPIYYYNTTGSTKPNPLGIGWSWNIPYLETKTVDGITKKFVSLGDGSVYEVNGTTLKGDIWNQYTFSLDATDTRNDPEAIPSSDDQSKYVLSSIDGRNYYFNAKGHLLVISDSYGNQIKFYYQEINPYGTVIRAIEDSIGNQIQIEFTNVDNTELVVIKDDNKTVTYRKEKKSNQDTLSQIIDDSGITTFSYDVKQAQFNLLGTDPLMDNPYMLLTSVTHPTQVKTIYNYEDTPVKNFLGQTSVNQFYKIRSRYDEVFYSDQTSDKYNKFEYKYVGDLGTQTDYTYQTIREGLTTTTYTIEKDYINDTTSPSYYILTEEESGTTIKRAEDGTEKQIDITRVTTNTYDKPNKNPLPIMIQIKNVDSTGGISSEVKIERSYMYGQLSFEDNSLQKYTAAYLIQEITLPSNSKFKKLLLSKETLENKQNANEDGSNGVETVETTFSYQFDLTSNNIKSKAITVSSNNKILRKEESHLDSFGNTIENINFQKYTNENDHEELREKITFDSEYNAFPVKVTMDVKDAKDKISTITKEFGYDTQTGKITSYTDGNGYITDLQYDSLERLKNVTFVYPENQEDQFIIIPDSEEKNQTIVHEYNDKLNEIITTNEEGEKIKQKWNPLGWKIGEYVFQDGDYRSISQTDYDFYGRVMNSTDAKANVTQYYYDEWSRPIVTKSADYFYDPDKKIESGGKIRFFYDDVLHTVKTLDSNKNVIEEKSNEYGQILTKAKWQGEIDPNIKTPFEKYLYFGNDYQIEDAKGNKTCYRQDGVGQLLSVTHNECLSPNLTAQTYSYEYDLMGNMVQQNYLDINPDLIPNPTPQQKMMHHKKYDVLGRLISEQGPEGGAVSYFYDKNDNLIEKLDKNQNKFINQYNHRNFLKAKNAYQNSELKDKIEFKYDRTGRVKERIEYVDSQPQKTTYDYFGPNDTELGKKVGLLKKITLPDEGTHTYQYDNNGNRTMLTLNLGGQSWSMNYSYDPQNRMDSVNVPISITGMLPENISETYTYQDNGLLETVTRPGSVKTLTYKGLLLDKLTEQTNLNNTAISNFEYVYDPNGNTIQISDSLGLQTFTYDELDRIKTSSLHQETYSYDSRGNRHTLESKQLPTMETADYEYDVWNSLSKVTTKDGKIVEYRYNGDGLLEERTENNITTRYYYDGDQIIAEGTVGQDGKAVLKARYIRGANGLVAKVSDDPGEKMSYGGIAYYHTNGHGDVVSLRDKQGEILKSYSYDVWGNIESEVSNKTISNPFMYSGEYWDSTAKLQYLRARWYDPSQGRFISEDSYKGDNLDPLSLNLYTYVENNPLKYTDPSGNHPVILIAVGAYKLYSLYSSAKDAKKIYQAYNNGDYEALKQYGSAFVLGVLVGKLGAKILKNAKLTKFLECNCFTAGTKVLTDEGEKNIEDIEVGDRVLAKSDVTGEVAYKKVTGLFQKQSDEIYSIYIGKEVIEATKEHPVWIDGKGWTEVRDLRVWDLLVTSDGLKIAIDKIEKEPRVTTVYNFEVEDFHSYFVSNLGIWVHNCRVVSSRFANNPIASQVETLDDKLYNMWNKGSYYEIGDSLLDHYNRHAKEVSATDLAQYVRKAEGFAQNLRGATWSYVDGKVEGVKRYKKNGKYIDIAPDGTIISFGTTKR
jgi:RHS repeat-associated protein